MISSSAFSLPLCVDLDGTFSCTDTLSEQLMELLRKRPWMLCALPLWLLAGRASFKARIAAAAPPQDLIFAFHDGLTSYLREQGKQGREIVLVTAANQRIATYVASLFPFFQEGVGSDENMNLAGDYKAHALVERYGEKGFVYAGNERRDLRVWKHAAAALVMRPSPNLLRSVSSVTIVGKACADRPHVVRSIIRLLRPYQWIKNILIFVPVLTAHQFGRTGVLSVASIAFVAFCCAASGAYTLNDLVDLPSDRLHETKKRRPLAAGDVPLWSGMVLPPLFFMVAAGLSLWLPPPARIILVIYVVLTLLYSFIFKRVFLLDATILALLYALRLMMGHVATGIATSPWLTAFALCIFFSLALLKRFSELLGRASGYAPGRGYHVDHRGAIGIAGVSSGIAASLLIIFYAWSAHVTSLYSRPFLLLLLCPLFLFWIVRMWWLGYRGAMHDDPVYFMFRDILSMIVGCTAVVVMLLAR